MKRTIDTILIWAPRILAIMFAGFISLFALDVFSEGYTLGESLLGFAIHMVPTALIVFILIVSWRRMWIGAVAFICLGIWYIAITGGSEDWLAYVIIPGPCFLLAALYFVNWIRKSGRE